MKKRIKKSTSSENSGRTQHFLSVRTGNKVFFLLFHFIFPSHTVLHFLDHFFSSWIEKMCVVFDSKGMEVVGGRKGRKERLFCDTVQAVKDAFEMVQVTHTQNCNCLWIHSFLSRPRLLSLSLSLCQFLRLSDHLPRRNLTHSIVPAW